MTPTNACKARSPPWPVLERYAYLSATRADVLSRLGRQREARAAYDVAIDLTDNETERRFLRARRSP